MIGSPRGARSWACSAALVVMMAATTAAAQDPERCMPTPEDVGLPVYKGDSPPSHVLVCHAGFVLSHDSETRMPDWVLEVLTPARFQGPGDRDRSSFQEDPFLESLSKPQASDDDYTGSGFDRGHMAPAADMKPDQAMMNESHFFSNISPQVGIGFNRHVWAELEEAVRDWTLQRLRLIVITGPIYDDGDRRMRGTEIPVPPRFYKIAFEPGRNRAIAFIFPNKKIKGRELAPFISTIDDIEAATGLDFLPNLDRRIERRIERNKSAMWKR